MSWIPGWDSIAGTGWWSGFYFWASIACLIGLGVAEVASHRYSERKDDLAGAEQREIQHRHDEDMARVQHDTAIANESAAILEKEAASARQKTAEAQLALEQLRKQVRPRFVGSEFIEALKGKPTARASIVYPKDDSEAFALAGWIVAGLVQGGWTLGDFKPIESAGTAPFNVLPSLPSIRFSTPPT